LKILVTKNDYGKFKLIQCIINTIKNKKSRRKDMGKYIELNASNFEATIAEGTLLVDFWAPWCGPCRMLAPVIEELAEEFDGKAKICKVNTDEEQDIAVKYGIRSIPTILFFKDGELVDQMVGASSKQVLADKINSLK
jgi:thioredoxin 1